MNKPFYLPWRSHNPFQHRWKINDKQWMMRRKSHWASLKSLVEGERFPGGFRKRKALMHLKHFWLEGVMPPSRDGDVQAEISPAFFLFWTPHDSVTDVREVFDYIVNDGWSVKNAEPYKKPKQEIFHRLCSSNYWACSSTEFGIAGPNILAISEAVIPYNFHEEYFSENNRTYLEVDPQFIIDVFEKGLFYFLTHPLMPPFYAGGICIDYYFSCVSYVVAKGVNPHGDYIKHAISMIFNFVEPRGYAGEATEAEKITTQLRQRLLSDSVPASVSEMVSACLKNRSIECYRDEGLVSQLAMQYESIRGSVAASIEAIALPRFVEKAEGSKVVNDFVNAAHKVGLIKNKIIPAPKSVDLRVDFTNEFAQMLGFPDRDCIPAWCYEFWFEKDSRFSSDSFARQGAAIFVFYPRDASFSEGFPGIFYKPMLNEFYRKILPTESVLLMERQLRRAFRDFCGKDLKFYEKLDHVDSDFYEEDKRAFEDPEDIFYRSSPMRIFPFTVLKAQPNFYNYLLEAPVEDLTMKDKLPSCPV